MPQPEHHSWWLTLPGLITAVGGIVTAVAGLIVALHSVGWLKPTEDRKKQNSEVTPSAQTASRAPDAVEPDSKAPALNETSRPSISSGVNLLSANALYREFQANPVDASNRYAGKAVALEGLRGEMILTSDGVQAAVHIVDGSRSNALILVFSDRNQLSGINKGQRFRFKCMVDKYEYSIVWMEDCSIDR